MASNSIKDITPQMRNWTVKVIVLEKSFPHKSRSTSSEASSTSSEASYEYQRCRFNTQLHDSTGSIFATIFGRNVENLFSVTALQLIQNTNEEGVVDTTCFGQQSTKKEYYIQLKKNFSKTQDTIIAQYIVTKVLEKPEESKTMTP